MNIEYDLHASKTLFVLLTVSGDKFFRQNGIEDSQVNGKTEEIGTPELLLMKYPRPHPISAPA